MQNKQRVLQQIRNLNESVKMQLKKSDLKAELLNNNRVNEEWDHCHK